MGADKKESLSWYTKAAEQEVLIAETFVATVYSNGEMVAQDDKQAAYWLERAANHGEKTAQYSLALMYLKGEGMSKDMTTLYTAWGDLYRKGVA